MFHAYLMVVDVPIKEEGIQHRVWLGHHQLDDLSHFKIVQHGCRTGFFVVVFFLYCTLAHTLIDDVKRMFMWLLILMHIFFDGLNFSLHSNRPNGFWNGFLPICPFWMYIHNVVSHETTPKWLFSLPNWSSIKKNSITTPLSRYLFV